LKMSTTKPFSQWTVIALREFLKERGVRSSGLKAQLVDLAQQYFLLKTFKIIVEKALFVLGKGLQSAVFYCFVTKKLDTIHSKVLEKINKHMHGHVVDEL
jgi:hypothetical protein